MKKNLLLFTAIILIPFLLSAQQLILDAEHNMFRPNDRIIKQQIEYKFPGDSGEDVIWDFNHLQPVNDEYELLYEGDSVIIGREHRTCYKYLLQNDSLFFLGFENATTFFKNNQPELYLEFPIVYGKKNETYFYGQGKYSAVFNILSCGKSYIEADAYGKLILPDGEMLHNVLRVHRKKVINTQMIPLHNPDSLSYDNLFSDNIEFLLNNDSLRIETNTYSWYVEGYRYPVFETINTTTYKFDNVVSNSNTAFLFTPVEQYYGLDEDSYNSLKRERSSLNGDSADKCENDSSEDSKDLSEIIELIIDVNANTLRISYHLPEGSDVRLLLSDVQGWLVYSGNMGNQPEGSHVAEIDLSALMPGEYGLGIFIGSNHIGRKIIKK